MASEYPANSRYFGIDTAEITGADGRTHVYLKRRFLPQSDALQALEEHLVKDGERLDQIAAEHFADPLLFWRLCDANDALAPQDALEPLDDQARRLRITLPAGLGGGAP